MRVHSMSWTVAAQIGENGLEITELPVRKWTQDYKEFLEGMVKPEDKNEVRKAYCLKTLTAASAR